MAHEQHAYSRGVVALAAGGTGGHLFPAQALAEALVRRDFAVHLMTDSRVKGHDSAFPAAAIHQIRASTITPRRPWKVPMQLLTISAGFIQARIALARLGSDVRTVVGFGGYPTLPSLMAASTLGLDIIIHEQNAVLGRANRMLANRAQIIASSFPEVSRLPKQCTGKVVFTGNPVRDSVAQLRSGYTAPDGAHTFNLLVFGGSQGAKFFSDAIPEAIGLLPHAVRRKLNIVQQCRAEDLERVKAAYETMNVSCQAAAFFTDLPQRIANAHLVICRSGASTVAELSAIGRPSILVPLPHSLDNDQALNARALNQAGGAWLVPQAEFSSDTFVNRFTRLRFKPEELAATARAALEFGRVDGAERLADVVEALIIPEHAR